MSCLDQLEGEIDKIGQDSREEAKAEVILSEEEKQAERVRNDKCPIFLNFESEVEHTFTCRNPDCENVARKPEIFRDFSLEIIEPPPGARYACASSATQTVGRSGELGWLNHRIVARQINAVASHRCKTWSSFGFKATRLWKCDVASVRRQEKQTSDISTLHYSSCAFGTTNLAADPFRRPCSFLRLPRVLILHLKRFKPLPTDIFAIRKLQDMVRLNKTIDLGTMRLPTLLLSSPPNHVATSTPASGFCCDRRTFDPFAPGPLNLPSHDAAFSPTSRSPSLSHSPSSAPSPSSPFSTSVASVKSSEFKVPAPHSKVVVPPTSSFPTGGTKGGERIDDDLSTIIEGGLANNKRQRTQSSDSTSTSANGTKLSEEEMMARALKESEMTFAAVERAKEEERIRKEQEELDMAIALSLEEGQDDEQRVSLKRKRITNATEVPPAIIV